MTEAKLQKLFELWKHRLGLDLWHIEIRVEKPETDTALFQIRRSTVYNRAIVSAAPWIVHGGSLPENVLDVTITDEFIEAGVVHELLHCTRHHSQALVVERLEGQVHRDVYTVVVGSYEDVLELEVENLAVALVKAWPK